MKEVAFKVRKDSEFYKKYFEAQEEKKKFKQLAEKFLDENGFQDVKESYMSDRLMLDLSHEQREKYKNELIKDTNKYGLSCFKMTSQTQKKWKKEVWEKINSKLISNIKLWFWGIISVGKYKLWDYNGDLYGYLLDNEKNEINLPGYMEEMKMSEYYKIIEEYENNGGFGK